jgi:hypothetical protein
LTVGYRERRVAVFASGSINGADLRVEDFTNDPVVGVPENGVGYVRSFGVDVGVQFMPLARGRFDPFLLAALGYVSTVAFARSSPDDTEYEFRTKRAGLRLATGWPFYVSRKVSMGPRVDVVLPMAGEACERLTGPTDEIEACRSMQRLSRGLTEFEKRYLRRDMPKPWSASWEVRVTF